MVKSKSKIEKQLHKKTNTVLVETVIASKKNKAWNKVAEILSGPRKQWTNTNLDKIKEDVVVPGKVLSQGEAGKHKVVAFSFSDKAKEKIDKAGGKSISILEEIKSNPELKGIKILDKK